MKKAFQKESQKSESDVNVSENQSDFPFAKHCQIPTTFPFEFELRDILNSNAFLVQQCSKCPSAFQINYITDCHYQGSYSLKSTKRGFQLLYALLQKLTSCVIWTDVSDSITCINFMSISPEFLEFWHPQFCHSPLTWLVTLTTALTSNVLHCDDGKPNIDYGYHYRTIRPIYVIPTDCHPHPVPITAVPIPISSIPIPNHPRDIHPHPCSNLCEYNSYIYCE